MQPLFHLLFEIFRHLICCQKTLFKQILFSVQSPPHMMKQPPTDELLFQVRNAENLKEKRKKAQLSLTMIFRIIKCSNNKEALIVAISR